MKKNKELSKKYGLSIYDSKNMFYPYYVKEWDECFTEQEIAMYVDDHFMIQNINIED